jgi:hypothetical protein
MDNELRNDLIGLETYLIVMYDPYTHSHIQDTLYALSHITLQPRSAFLSAQNGSVYINIPRRSKKLLVGTYHPDKYPDFGILPTYLYVRWYAGHEAAMESVETYINGTDPRI